MKKTISLLLVALLALCILAGCATPAEPETEAATEKPTEAPTEKPVEQSAEDSQAPAQVYEMKIAHCMAVESPRHQSLEFFKTELEKMTNGQIKVELFPAGQLGSEAEMVEQVKMGTIQGTRGGQFELVAPKMLIYTMPFLFDSMDDFMKVTKSPIHQEIIAGAADNNIIVTAMGDAGGFRQWTNNIKPFTDPSDFKGLKMRTSGVLSITKTLEALGASAVAITFTDLYMGLKTGVVDGQCNAYTQIENGKLYEVQKYVTESNYTHNPEGFYVNLEWFNSLPKDLQDAVMECSAKSVEMGNQIIEENMAGYIETIKQYCEINVLTPEQKQAFRDAVMEPVYGYFINEEKLFTQEELDEVIAASQS